MMIWELSLLIMAVAVIILVAFMVPTLIQLRNSIKRFEDMTAKLDSRMPAILANVDDITSNMKLIIESGKQQTQVVGEAVAQLKGVVDDVVQVEKNIKRQIDSKLIRSLATLTAGAKAAHAFMAVIRDDEPPAKPKRQFFRRKKKV